MLQHPPSPWCVSFSALLIIAIVLSPFSLPLSVHQGFEPEHTYSTNAKQSYLAARQTRILTAGTKKGLSVSKASSVPSVIEQRTIPAPTWLREAVIHPTESKDLQEQVVPGADLPLEETPLPIRIAAAEDTDDVLLPSSIPDAVIAMGGVYDAVSGTVDITVTASEVVSLHLDSDAQVTSQTDVHGETTMAEYNEAGDPIKIVDPDGTVTYYAYDPDGNLTSTYTEQPEDQGQQAFMGSLRRFFLTAFAGHTDDHQATSIRYAPGGAVASVTDDTGTVSYAYDAEGNPTSVSDVNGVGLTYEYDELGNVVGMLQMEAGSPLAMSPIGRLMGSLKSLVYADAHNVGTNASYEYDAFNNPESVSIAIAGITAPPAVQQEPAQSSLSSFSSSVSSSFSVSSLSAAGNDAGTNELSSAASSLQDPVPASAVSAPAADVLPPTDSAVSSSAAVPEVQPAASDVSVPAPVEAPAAEPVSVLDRLLTFVAPWTLYAEAQDTNTVQAGGSVVAPSIAARYTFDAFGNKQTAVNQFGQTTTYTYDLKTDFPLGRTVTDPLGAVLYDVRYTATSDMRWTGRTDSAGRKESYSFDAAGQLHRIIGTSSVEYSYDEAGNRISEFGTSGSNRYVYTGNRLLTRESEQGGTVSYAYDADGNAISRTDAGGVTHYLYSLNNAFIGADFQNGDSVRYTLDPLKRRTMRTVIQNGVMSVLRYGYDGSKLTTVTDESGTILRRYVYDQQGTLLAVVSGDVMYAAVTDGQGSLTMLTDERSGVSRQVSYDVWGAIQGELQGVSEVTYAGYFYDPLAKLYLLGPRAYDPAIGRFLSKDPLAGLADSTLTQNEYIYALNDPVNRTDPTGHASEQDTISASPKAMLQVARATLSDMQRVHEYAVAALAERTATLQTLQQGVPEAQLLELQSEIRQLETAVELAQMNRREAESLVADNSAYVEQTRRDYEAQTALLQAEKAVESSVSSSTSSAENAVSTSQSSEGLTFSSESSVSLSTSSTSATSSAESSVTEQQSSAATEPVPVSPALPGESIVPSAYNWMRDHDFLSVAYAKKASAKKSSPAKSQSQAKKQVAQKQQVVKNAVKAATINKTLVAAQRRLDTAKVKPLPVSNARLASTVKVSARAIRTAKVVAQNPKQVKTLDASLTSVSPLIVRQQTVAWTGINLGDIWNSVITTVKTVVVSTVQDGKVCIANGGVQECLSTCGIAMDGATMAAGATIIAAPAALGTAVIGAGCDFSNGLIYFFKGERILAGASMFAVIPIVGMVGKPAGQVIKLSAKEAAEVVAQVAAKEAAERAAKAVIKSSDLIFSESKIIPQMAERGWTKESVKVLIDNPYTTRVAANKTVTPNRPATVFYAKDGTYVSVDNITKEVIQITDNIKIFKGVPWSPDSSIINPYLPQ